MISLTQSQLITARAMAQWFTPPAPGFPSAAEADPDEHVLGLVLDQLEPVLPGIVDALDAAAGQDITAYLEQMEREQPERFALLRVLFVGRYLTCRPVWELLGYPGRLPAPVRAGEAEQDLAGGLLNPVISRGKIYRPTPTVTSGATQQATRQEER
ncbi:MAG: hypothetical protein J2P27_10470, partial [Actinobacteria bacterium]|nr:hypothetical protein [Actinomycetota bacterium]